MATIHGTNLNDNDTIQFPLGFVKKVRNTASLTSSDSLYGYAGDDIIVGDGGNDVMYGDRSSSAVISLGFQGSDRMFGGAGNDRLYGDGGNDFLYGQADNDILYGGDGNDQLFGGSNSGNGVDYLYGDSGNDTLYGDDSETSGGIDYLYGGSGNDKLFGRAGNDLLRGQAASSSLSIFEKDELTGGAGSDTFVVSGLYQNNGSNDFAQIKDWHSGRTQDKLDVANPNGVLLFQVSANTWDVVQTVRSTGILGDQFSNDLVARVTSGTLFGQSLADNIQANLI
jgi:Ca2+-binding RTX toxin-like protein